MRIGTVTLLRAPVERTLAWVAYHLNSGIDAMHLFFDDPADPAAELLDDVEQVQVHRCDDKFWSLWRRRGDGRPGTVPARQVTILRRLLREPPSGVDWLVHIDSDELLWSGGDLGGDLSRALDGPAAHVQFLPLEAVPPKPDMADPFREVRLFKEIAIDREEWARRLGADAPFRGHRFFRGHVRGKPAIRLDGSVPSMRIHGPSDRVRQRSGFTSEVADKVRLLHYDAGSFDDWRSKWEDRLLHPVGAMSPARRRQERRFRRAARSPDLDRLYGLYRREYMLRPWDARVLRALGMVRRIDIPAELFDMPQPARTPAGPLIPRQRGASDSDVQAGTSSSDLYTWP